MNTRNLLWPHLVSRSGMLLGSQPTAQRFDRGATAPSLAHRILKCRLLPGLLILGEAELEGVIIFCEVHGGARVLLGLLTQHFLCTSRNFWLPTCGRSCLGPRWNWPARHFTSPLSSLELASRQAVLEAPRPGDFGSYPFELVFQGIRFLS